MKRVRVIVEVDVPDATDLTEHRFGWIVRERIGLSHPRLDVGIERTDIRRVAIKEFRRVLQYLPGGVRAR